MHRTEKYLQHSSIIKASLAKLLSVCLRTKWLWVRIPLQSSTMELFLRNSRQLFLQKAPSYLFDWVLNIPLCYAWIVGKSFGMICEMSEDVFLTTVVMILKYFSIEVFQFCGLNLINGLSFSYLLNTKNHMKSQSRKVSCGNLLSVVPFQTRNQKFSWQGRFLKIKAHR